MTETLPEVEESTREVGFDPEGAVTRLGLIALATDLTIERDAARLIPPDRAALHVSRVAFENPTTPENLLRMAPRLTEAAALLVPDTALAAIGYACTSASVAIGDEVIEASIHQARPGVSVVTPTGAARQALAALGVRRVALLTPYRTETTRPMAEYFARHGLEMAAVRCLGLADDRWMARISRETIVAEALAADTPEAEALFLSCTALPALGVIDTLEQRLGKPAVSSNQAMLWAMLRHGGLPMPDSGFGRLFRQPLPR